MSNVHLFKNTEKDFKCVFCGSENVSIIREDKVNPKLKCNHCMGMFAANDSLEAEKAGTIPTSSPESLSTAPEPEERIAIKEDSQPTYSQKANSIPRAPKFVFISKKRDEVEFSTSKNLKQTALRWEAQDKKFDVFELTARKSIVRLDIE